MQFDQYQLDAVKKMKSGSILVGGVGSGKSRTGLYYYFVKECGGTVNNQLYSPMKSPKDLYIITTAAKRDKKEWQAEMVPFLLSDNKDKCINHVTVVVDSWNNIKKYENVKDSFFIFDEQRVVGGGTWAKTFVKIAKMNHWILLSATPGDTWSDYISVFVANGFYKNRTEFIKRHVVFSRFVDYPKIERYIETDLLDKHLKSIIVRMDIQRDVIKHSVTKICQYDKEKYDTVVKTSWNPFEDEPIENASAYVSVLRKIVNSDRDRVRQLEDLLDGHPTSIIFYNFDYELEILRDLCYSMRLEYGEWNGHKHMQVPIGDRWTYLVQYNAGSEGWNCTTTDTIIFYSLNYSYRMTHQAAGRIDRRNSSFSDLWYFYLRSTSKIDVSIMQCLSQKRDFNEKKFYEKMDSQKKQLL